MNIVQFVKPYDARLLFVFSVYRNTSALFCTANQLPCRGQIRHAECSRSMEAIPKKKELTVLKNGPLMRMTKTASIKPHYDRCEATEHSRFSAISWIQTQTGRLNDSGAFCAF